MHAIRWTEELACLRILAKVSRQFYFIVKEKAEVLLVALGTFPLGTRKISPVIAELRKHIRHPCSAHDLLGCHDVEIGDHLGEDNIVFMILAQSLHIVRSHAKLLAEKCKGGK